MKRPRTFLALVALALLGCLAAALVRFRRDATDVPRALLSLQAEDWAPAGPRPAPSFAADVAPLLEAYCLECHTFPGARGGVTLHFPDGPAAARAFSVWEKVAGELRLGSMPPAGRPRPTPAELDVLDAWLDAVFARDPAPEKGTGRLALRRLNRAEYNNTIRDLIGLDLRPADDFPADDGGHGFDNIAAVLSTSPLLMEKYLAAAARVVEAAFRDDRARRRILNPPADNVPVTYRGYIAPVREQPRKRLILSGADLPPVDPKEDELQQALNSLRAFADRAYRRPATQDELVRLLRLVEAAQRNGEGTEKGLRLALRAVLVSPHFLFRNEAAARPERRQATNQFQLAARLSYFLWSSMPDDELFDQAVRGTLLEGNNLSVQTQRMLRDPRSRALTENFAGQWLQTRALKDVTPDPDRFPDFDEPLRKAMRQETELFFASVVGEDRSILDLLDADYTFLNERLARHYGIRGISGEQFRKVSVAGTPRGGILTQGSVLVVTSNPTRTSPVKRGRWILENVLGASVPPPPPGVEGLREDGQQALSGTLRQRLEQHRRNPGCASCHRRLDPLGFALESFDAVGAWRAHEGGHAIDASGVLPGGARFAGSPALRVLLKKRRDAFARCLTEKLLTYALGRGLERSDRPAVNDIACKLARNDYRFSALVLALVHSAPFQIPSTTRGAP
jgi:hypothetical protein